MVDDFGNADMPSNWWHRKVLAIGRQQNIESSGINGLRTFMAMPVHARKLILKTAAGNPKPFQKTILLKGWDVISNHMLLHQAVQWQIIPVRCGRAPRFQVVAFTNQSRRQFKECAFAAAAREIVPQGNS